MSVDDKKQPIVVKKINKGGHGHHGGSWKVAYADFVTAMMAFFLLMWLLGSTSEGTKAGIAEWFNNPSMAPAEGGASTSMIDFGGSLDVVRSEEGEIGKKEDITPDEVREMLADKERLDELLQQLKELIESTPSLKDFKDQLLLDITSEGLRIQIVDKENRPMFDLGGTQLKWYTKEILRELAKTIDEVPNRVSITGHTDATPYASDRRDYSNWELSADRANAARRELVVGGLGKKKQGRVVGLSDSVLFDRDNPYNPVNRRISIIVLNKATERAIGLEPAEQDAAETGPAEASPPGAPAEEPRPVMAESSPEATASAGPAALPGEQGDDIESALSRVLGEPAE